MRAPDPESGQVRNQRHGYNGGKTPSRTQTQYGCKAQNEAQGSVEGKTPKEGRHKRKVLRREQEYIRERNSSD